jgi:hypothetical protein
MERAQRERRERDIRAMEREVDARSGDAHAAAVAAAEREALSQHHAAAAGVPRWDEDADRRRVLTEVDDVLRAVGGPPNRALPSMLTPLGSGKPLSRAASSTRGSDHGDDFLSGAPGGVERASSEPVASSLGPARVGGPVVRDVFAKGGGGSHVALPRHAPRLSSPAHVGGVAGGGGMHVASSAAAVGRHGRCGWGGVRGACGRKVGV